jgi:hypothetical protein
MAFGHIPYGRAHRPLQQEPKSAPVIAGLMFWGLLACVAG